MEDKGGGVEDVGGEERCGGCKEIRLARGTSPK